MPHAHALLAILISFFGEHHARHQCPLSAGTIAKEALGAIESARDLVGFRPAAPRVVLREALPMHPDPSGDVLSADHPQYWTAVPYGPLTVKVQLVADPAMLAAVGQVVLMIDGEPISNNRSMTGPLDPPELSPDGQLLRTYVYNLPCPELGKHLIQARYKVGGIWSELSTPLRYEVRLPQPPRIIALGDSPNPPAPLGDIGLVSVHSSSVTLKLANVVAHDKILVEINGKTVAPPLTIDHACCVSVPVQGHVASGVHRIAVRSIHGADRCSITSELSNEVAFHYHHENVYLLRPGRGCENCPPVQAVPAAPDLVPPPPPAPSHSWSPPRKDLSVLDTANRVAPMIHDEQWSGSDAPTSTAPATYTLTALLAQPNPVQHADRLRDRGNQLHSLIPPAVQEIHDITSTISENAKTTSDDVVAAIQQRDAAVAARDEAERAWQETKVWAEQAEQYRVAEAKAAIDALAQHRQGAWDAYQQAKSAASAASTHANVVRAQANAAQDRVGEVAQVRDLAGIAAREAATALARVGVLHHEVVQQRATHGDGAAEVIRKQLENEINVVDAQGKEIAALRSRSLQLRRTSEEHLRAGAVAKGKAANEYQIAHQAAQVAKQAASTAKRAVMEAQEAAETAARSAAPINRDDVKILAKQLARQAVTLLHTAQSHAETAAHDASQATQMTTQLDTALQHASQAAHEAAEHAATAYRHLQLEMKWCDAVMMRHTFHHSDLAKQHAAAAKVAEESAKQWRDAARRAQQQANQHAADAARHAASAVDVRSEIERLVATGDTNVDGYLRLQRWIAKLHEHVHAAQVSQLLAAGAKQRTAEAKQETEDNVKTAREAAEAAKTNAVLAAETRVLQSDAEAAWHGAHVRDLQRDAIHRRDAAQPGVSVEDSHRVDVLNAWADKDAALRNAQAEELKADARIAAAEANERIARATATHAPPSPFYFASAAYFPIRDFGFHGEVFDREGAVIHEDMKFSFDRDGNYALEFAISTPAVPATVRMQLLIQPSSGAPWYTITLPAMQFKPEAAERRTTGQAADEKECVVVYNHKCSGRSEVLRRCYPQMAGDATIRREGTARFGHGFEITRQAAAF